LQKLVFIAGNISTNNMLHQFHQAHRMMPLLMRMIRLFFCGRLSKLKSLSAETLSNAWIPCIAHAIACFLRLAIAHPVFATRQ